MIDPWGGSYYVEALTMELARKAWAHIVECEAQGGMTKAIEAGLPKMRIADAAARTQALIDSGRQTDYRAEQVPACHRRPDQRAEDRQHGGARGPDQAAEGVAGAARPGSAVDAALDALTECARTGQGNLLDLSIKAARLKASVGEISSALEKVYGRFQPTPQLATGVYAKQVGETMDVIKQVRAKVEAFVQSEGGVRGS